MYCDSCGSQKLVDVYAKSSDRNSIYIHDINYEHHGYVLPNLGIGDIGDMDDYIEFTYCLYCGKIQGKFPIEDNVVKDTLRENGSNRDGN
jgi:hypothetical protein